jgi:predicted amidophosphoribosyltransferase
MWPDALADAGAIVLPVECVGCGAANRAICGRCRDALARAPGHVRLVAGVRCDAAYVYEGLVRLVLLAIKVHGRTELVRVLRGRFRTLVAAAGEDASAGAVRVRVPPSRSGMLRRGFDPVRLFLGRCPPGAPGAPGAPGRWRPRSRLVRVRRPHDRANVGQKSRSAIDRVEATVGSFRAVGVAGRRVVLVDDVVTTGVTMADGIRAIRAAGGTVVRCVAVASVED